MPAPLRTGEGGSDGATRELMSWLADRLEGGERLQRPDVGVQGAILAGG